MKKILFQGDSITDCYRPRDDDRYLGAGYAELVSGEMQYKFGGEYGFVNRGISGNRITDLFARIKSDIINLKPDYVSILIGVNDVWHEIESQNGVSTETYEKIYCMLIETLLSEIPDVKILIMEPFVSEYIATRATEEQPNKWNDFYNGVLEKAKTAKRISQKYNLTFVPLQEKFDEAEKRIGIESITTDGVHPTPGGHKLIAEEWLRSFEKNFL